MSLVIEHREPTDAPIPVGVAAWRTCLREVVFLHEPDLDDQSAMLKQAGHRLAEGDAYRLLLEILCGLRSPMLGETQVMGQFKAFLAESSQACPWLHRVGQRLLADAREIRTKHLTGLGSRSYGSAVRRDVADSGQAAILGAGKLAQEVLPFLAEGDRRVDLWGRSDVAAEHASGSATYRKLDQIDATPVSPLPTVLIVAAPVPSEVVEQVASRYSCLLRVIDLRGEPTSTPIRLPVPIVSLQDLFARMSDAQASATARVEAARADIAWRARQFELRDELRPFGWDDLCA